MFYELFIRNFRVLKSRLKESIGKKRKPEAKQRKI